MSFLASIPSPSDGVFNIGPLGIHAYGALASDLRPYATFDDAIAFAEKLVAENAPLKKVRDRTDKLTADNIPVAPTTSAAGALVGKVAGATIIRSSGAPGSGVTVQLRSPVSQFGSTSPLYVVDGVFLNSTQSVTTLDIESMDIASIEVIKGAAAASLYGSRAASGVISITTNRGKNLALGQTQFSLRNEFGRDQISKTISKPTGHAYRINAQGQYVDANGNVVFSKTLFAGGGHYANAWWALGVLAALVTVGDRKSVV